MTSSNGNIFRVTGHLCGEFTGPRWIPRTKAQGPVTPRFDVFFDLRLNKRLSKQSWGWWFETLSRPLWRHRNIMPQSSPGLVHCHWDNRKVAPIAINWLNHGRCGYKLRFVIHKLISSKYNTRVSCESAFIPMLHDHAVYHPTLVWVVIRCRHLPSWMTSHGVIYHWATMCQVHASLVDMSKIDMPALQNTAKRNKFEPWVTF